MRKQLTSIDEDEISDINVAFEKAGQFYTVFKTLRALRNLKVTETRVDNLAEKRSHKRSQIVVMPPPTSQFPPTWVGPPAPIQSEDEVQRVVSISDPSHSSAGSKLFHACQENETQLLGNAFCSVALDALFRESPSVNWVTGRDELPVVEWRSRYCLNHHC